jgi:shikimate kinase
MLVIEELSQRKGVVLATGGGAMMRKENQDYVSRNGFVIYLNTSVDQQYNRTHKDRNRPLLQGDKDAYEVLSELFELRDPIYRDVADLVMNTDKKSLKSVVNSIIDALEGTEPLNG